MEKGEAIFILILASAAWLLILYWLKRSGQKNHNEPSEQYQQNAPKAIEQISAPDKIIVDPTIIQAKPKLGVSIIDGDYRTFHNYQIGNDNYTFGFPKASCKDQRVWVGKGNKETNRVSIEEANRLIVANQKKLDYKNDSSFDDDLPF